MASENNTNNNNAIEEGLPVKIIVCLYPSTDIPEEFPHLNENIFSANSEKVKEESRNYMNKFGGWMLVNDLFVGLPLDIMILRFLYFIFFNIILYYIKLY